MNNIQRKPVGGFFELELPKKGSLFHDSALALANGRVCFRVLLERIKPSKVFLPFYCCDMLIQPLTELSIPHEFYAINDQFDPVNVPYLADSELFVFVNYFGLKTQTARRLSKLLGEQLVIDNTQAFFEKSYGLTWAFNSARKFFGVPDGGFLYSPHYLEDRYVPNKPIVTEHLWLSLCGEHEAAFKQYQYSETQQTNVKSGMSDLTKRILYGVDFPNASRARKRHFRILDRALRHLNQMPSEILETVPTVVPFCYPLLLKKPVEKTALYQKRVYIPTFWMEILTRNTEGYDFEKSLVNNLLLLPVDHRLDESDLRHIVESVLKI